MSSVESDIEVCNNHPHEIAYIRLLIHQAVSDVSVFGTRPKILDRAECLPITTVAEHERTEERNLHSKLPVSLVKAAHISAICSHGQYLGMHTPPAY